MGPSRFGNDAVQQVTYGSCLVNIPVEHHTRGEIEVPSYWWQSRDPQKYFLVEALDTLALDTFLQTLSADDVLLFVHGYNTSFEAAILRTAQLVHDLGFPGKGVTFSWPSEGTLDGYVRDETRTSTGPCACRSLQATDPGRCAVREEPKGSRDRPQHGQPSFPPGGAAV